MNVEFNRRRRIDPLLRMYDFLTKTAAQRSLHAIYLLSRHSNKCALNDHLAVDGAIKLYPAISGGTHA